MLFARIWQSESLEIESRVLLVDEMIGVFHHFKVTDFADLVSRFLGDLPFKGIKKGFSSFDPSSYRLEVTLLPEGIIPYHAIEEITAVRESKEGTNRDSPFPVATVFVLVIGKVKGLFHRPLF